MSKKTKTQTISLEAGEKKVGELARYVVGWMQKHIFVEPGVRMVLGDYQVDFVASFLAQADPFDISSLRLIRRGVLSLPRKNGKTTLAAGLVLAQLSSKWAHISGAVDKDSFFCSAQSFDQSALGFNAFAGMISRNPKLAAIWSVNPGMKTAENQRNYNRVTTLGTRPESLMGRLAYCCAFDELAVGRDMRVLDAIERSQPKNENWIIITSTMADQADNPLSDVINMTKQGHERGMLSEWMVDLHYADKDADIYSDETLFGANPGARCNPPLIDRRILEQMRDEARLNSTKRQSYRIYTLNQPITSLSPLIDLEKWKELGCTPEERDEFEAAIPGAEVDLGLDLSTTLDMSSLAAFVDGKYLKTHNYIAEAQVNDASHEDRMPYREIIEAGGLNACPGDIIDYDMIAAQIEWYFDNCKVRCVRYDPHKINQMRRELHARGIDYQSEEAKKIWVPVRQGWFTFTSIIARFEALVEGRAFKHEAGAILTAAISRCQVKYSSNLASGARSVEKPSRSAKIDAALASMMAMTHDIDIEKPKKKRYNFDRFFETLRGE